MEVGQDPFVVILGNAQDGGVPHIGVPSVAWDHLAKRRTAASLGIIDPVTGERWIVEATPDFKEQLHRLHGVASASSSQVRSPGYISGILISHAHIGHYLGLSFLGKEMMNAEGIPLYAMPKMSQFLRHNLPWSDLIRNRNVALRELSADTSFRLNERISITPLLVPHRDEHSETVGFRIDGPDRSLLFIPDIDRWEDWDEWGRRVEEEIAMVDYALLDGTFFDGNELPGRDMGKIPHPTISSSVERFASLPEIERRKIRFIHLNHSNPALDADSPECQLIGQGGFRVAEEGERLLL